LYYDRSKPYKKDIRYLKEYKSVKKLPYLQRILFKSVLEYYGSIKSNEITFTRLAKDTLIEVESYKIADYKTSVPLWRTLYPETLNWCLRRKARFRQIMLSKRDKKGVKYLRNFRTRRNRFFFQLEFFDTMLQQKKVTQAMFLRILQPRS
jgi:hypothetical protein